MTDVTHSGASSHWSQWTDAKGNLRVSVVLSARDLRLMSPEAMDLLQRAGRSIQHALELSLPPPTDP